ncbi:MAG: HAD-IA family hydrolase [Eubacterium sp.]|nr:HAD-IA family hydrolase [Eubacterium sp.]
MKYTTVIFDLDGTLLNTLEDLMDAVNYALEQFGYPVRTLAEIRAFVGNGVRTLMERALPDGAANPAFEEILKAFREYYTIHCEDKTHAYDGVLELMQQLKDAGIKMAIVSNKLDSAVKELNQSYFNGYVDAAIGETENIRRKPAADMVEHALAILKGKKQDTVYIGDSDVDIQTAANAGIDCISVSWGFRDSDFLRKCGASVIADTPQQVYDLILS